jgi:hypothetical protein
MKAKEINEGLFGNLSRVAKKTLDNVYDEKPKTNLFKTIKSKIASKFDRSGLSEKDKLAFEKFKNNFVARGAQAIDNAIKTGLADPNTNVISKAAMTGKKPAAKSTKELPAFHPQVELVNNEPVMLKFQKVMYVLNDKGQWVTSKTQKPVPQGMADFLNQQQEIAVKRAQMSVPKTRKKAQKPAAPAAQAAATPTPESHYQKLNSLFESYMLLSEQKQPSISQWFKVQFLDPYLQGIDLTTAKPQINQFLANLPNIIKSGSLKKELENIATIAWTLSQSSRR